MIEFQDKKKIRKMLYSWPVIILVAAALILLSSATYRMYLKMSDTGENRDTSLDEQTALLARQDALENHIEQLKTERGVEEEIRKKFRVVKDGESVIIVVDDKATGESATGTKSGFTSFLERIKDWFK
jgi:cell division protein FtsB